MAGFSNGFWIYKTLIDPLTNGLRRKIADNIEQESSVLDIACGPGTLLLELSPKIKEGIGIDLNPDKIASANAFISKRNIKNITFKVTDARVLEKEHKNKFDYVVLSLAVHQFPEPLRSEILRQALKSGEKVIIADYSMPVPRNLSGFLSKSIEKIAGKEHFNAYKSYKKQNGISGIMDKFKLESCAEEICGNGVFTVKVLSRKE